MEPTAQSEPAPHLAGANHPGVQADEGSYWPVLKVWLPIPIFFLLLEATFNLFFWNIPKLTGPTSDNGYRFSIDTHRMSVARASESPRILAFGSSVSVSFDARQVQGLLNAQQPASPVEVHRLMLPAIHPSDYNLFFREYQSRLRPDVAVVMFNLVDFLADDGERDLNATLRYVLPPWPTLRERYATMSLSGKLDLIFAGISDVYRYRSLIRSCLHDHVRWLQRWLVSARATQGYGIYADGYSKQVFGLPVTHGATFALRYFVDPRWIEQQGVVSLEFAMAGRVLATRTETEAGWKDVSLDLPETAAPVLDIVASSAWSPRVGGADADARLLGVKLAEVPPDAGSTAKSPLKYPPFLEGASDDFLRMGTDQGAQFTATWEKVLNSDTPFGARFRLYRDMKLKIRDRQFSANGEYAAIEALVKLFTENGTHVILVNTPESPRILPDYQDSDYYRSYLGFFRGLSEKYPHTQFQDLRDALPADDFNDWHHPNYIGAMKLGRRYAEPIRSAVAELNPDRTLGD